MEDLTPLSALEADPDCKRKVCMYGFIRGKALRLNQKVHIPGVGVYAPVRVCVCVYARTRVCVCGWVGVGVGVGVCSRMRIHLLTRVKREESTLYDAKGVSS